MTSRIRSRVLLFVLSVLVFSGVAASFSPPTNKYVRMSSKLQRSSLKPGGTSAFLFKLTPQKGIHVNTVPPIAFVLDSSSSVSLAGKLTFPTVRVDTSVYLDTAGEIKQPFAVARTLKPGPLMLKGTLTYFYCSDSEGWCSRFKQPIEVMITVVK